VNVSAQDACRSGKGAGRQVALLLFDIDGFKSVNDTLGHGAGGPLASGDRRGAWDAGFARADTFARVGGDEFRGSSWNWPMASPMQLPSPETVFDGDRERSTLFAETGAAGRRQASAIACSDPHLSPGNDSPTNCS